MSTAGTNEVERTRRALAEAVREHHRALAATQEDFEPGVTPILSSGASLDEADRVALAAAAADLRIAGGVLTARFERRFAQYQRRRKAFLTNSGSSANLLAVSALTSPQLGERRLRPGDEVITAATGFPTTVNPIVQNGLVPVFVDIDRRTYNTTCDRVEAAIGPRTRAVVLAHALGNPFEVEEIARLAAERGMWLVEDNCDAVGSLYRGRMTGTFGALSTVSFYPAHHLTTGEGGCVLTSDLELAGLVAAYRDWGRDCWCAPGEDDRCRKRFSWALGTLPGGYDHKYIFSQVGYNLKSTDLQAALGLTQLDRIEGFHAARRHNWARLRAELDGLPGLVLPEPTPDSDPSWFGFVLSVAPGAPFQRRDLQLHLEERQIRTRLLFSGNLTRHPAYEHVEYRVADRLENSDFVTEKSLWVGVHPGVTDPMIDYVVRTVRDFVGRYAARGGCRETPGPREMVASISSSTVERDEIRRRVGELEPWVNEFSFQGERYADGSRLDYLLSRRPDDRARDLFAAFPGTRTILELGALEGADTLALSRYPGVSVLALEGRAANLRRARLVMELHGVDNVELRLADVETLDFTALARVDAVVCAGLLYHVGRPWDLLRDIARVTDRLYLSTHYWGSPAELGVVDGYGVKPVREDHPDPQTRGLSVDVRWLDRESLLGALGNAGFSDVEVLYERVSDEVCDLVAVCRTARARERTGSVL